MSKRKPDKASKRARSPAAVTRAHEQKEDEDIVKSAKEDLLRCVAAGPIESPPELHDDPQEEGLKIEKQATPNDEGQEAPKVENQEGPIATNPAQHVPDQLRGFGFASATGNMVSYQMMLLGVTQANMRFAFDFSQKLLTVRSPFQLAELIVESTNRQADMVAKQSAELAARTRGWLQT
jgi:hypothetical protein